MMDKNGKRVNRGLVPSLIGKAFSFSPLNVLAVDIFTNVLSQVEDVPLYS